MTMDVQQGFLFSFDFEKKCSVTVFEVCNGGLLAEEFVTQFPAEAERSHVARERPEKEIREQPEPDVVCPEHPGRPDACTQDFGTK